MSIIINIFKTLQTLCTKIHVKLFKFTLVNDGKCIVRVLVKLPNVKVENN